MASAAAPLIPWIYYQVKLQFPLQLCCSETILNASCLQFYLFEGHTNGQSKELPRLRNIIYERVILTFFHASDDGCKVVIEQNHISCLLTDIWSCYAHRHSCITRWQLVSVPAQMHTVKWQWTDKITFRTYKPIIRLSVDVFHFASVFLSYFSVGMYRISGSGSEWPDIRLFLFCYPVPAQLFPETGYLNRIIVVHRCGP